MDESEGFVKVLGLNLFYRSFGPRGAPTVLALHGGGGSHIYLSPLTDLVQFGYRVVLFDQRGYGRSDAPKAAKNYTQRLAVEEVEAFRKTLRLGRVHLFGNSYGGALALDVGLRFPASVRSLVISSGFASEELLNREFGALALPNRVRAALAKYESKGGLRHPRYAAAFDVVLRTYYCRLPVWPYECWYVLRHLRTEVDHGRQRGWDITPRLPELKMPCLITVGRYDSVTPTCSRAIHRGIRGSRLVIFKKSSHVAFWEERPRYIEVLRTFLDRAN